MNAEAARVIRDELQQRLEPIYEAAPRTTTDAYLAAQNALKIKEDLTFSDEEIDALLPPPLKSTVQVKATKTGDSV